MKRFVEYLLVVSTILCGLGILHALLGVVLRNLALEYLVVVRNLSYAELFHSPLPAVAYGWDRGWRAGAVAAALLGAAGFVGGWPFVKLRDLLDKASFALLMATLGAALCGGAAFGLGHLGWLQLPEMVGRQLEHPFRVLAGWGLDAGLQAGALAGALLGAGRVMRKRAASRGPQTGGAVAPPDGGGR